MITFLLPRLLGVFRHSTPIDTGNLRRNATNGIVVKPNEISIYVDSEIAPYAVYTNEPWISPKWRGKKNPNEGWVDRGVYKVAQEVAELVGGDIID